MNTKDRKQPPPLVPLPFPTASIQEEGFYYDSDDVEINLGAESPRSILKEVSSLPVTPSSPRDEWLKAGIAAHTNVPARKPSWRSSTVRGRRGSPGTGLQKELVDRDCGICFELAVSPCRSLCCGKLYCLEHIAEWLHGASSEGLCPSCQQPCSLEKDFISLATPSLLLSPSPYPPPSSPPPTPEPEIIIESRSTSPSHSNSDTLSSTSGDDTQPSVSANSKTKTKYAVSPRERQHPSLIAGFISDAPERLAGKVLSIVGLTLVFYILLSSSGSPSAQE